MEITRHYQALDEFEFKRREELTRDLSVPLGMLTILCGFTLGLAGKLTFPFSSVEWFVGVSVVTSLTLLACSAVLLWRAHVGLEYKGPTTADLMEEYVAELKSWAGSEGREDLFQLEFERHLTKKQVQNAAFNARVNELRARRILRQKQIMIIALLFTSAAAFVHTGGIIFSTEYRASQTEIKS